MKRHVALIIETSGVYGRTVLSGIIRYMRVHESWSVFLEQRDLRKQPPSWLDTWQGDGIISRATTPRLAQAIQCTGVPLVELTDRHGESLLPQVRSDDAAIGRMGAEHLLERGFNRFAFCGFSREAWSRRREEAFKATVLERSGVDCQVYNSPWHGPAANSWDEERSQLESWLASCETPLGILACNDVRGQHIHEACANLGMSVPEQVAILGVDNDDLICRLCTPPLSSVMPNAEAVGFRAAETLAKLMDGQQDVQPVSLLPPIGIATRQSTDVVAINDRAVADALQYIRLHACEGLTVDEVVGANKVSRSTLERQVRKFLRRTPQEEIRRVQVNRAQELLMTTKLSLEKIAPMCGFEHPEYLHVVFKRVTGQTPGEFRKDAISNESTSSSRTDV